MANLEWKIIKFTSNRRIVVILFNIRPKNKTFDSQAVFEKKRCLWVAFISPVGYILEHFDLFGKTKWQWFYRKYLKCKFPLSTNIRS